MTTGILEDVQTELEFFFDDLNWTYIFMYVMILYGIKHKEEFIWYNDLFKKPNVARFKIWIAGLIVAGIFCGFRAMGEDVFDSEYVSQLLRSWIIVIVFNSIFSKKMQKIEKNDDLTKLP